jgi:hypothetical protein
MRETLVQGNDPGKEKSGRTAKPAHASVLLERERYYNLAE